MHLRHTLTPLLAALVATAGWAQPNAPAIAATEAIATPDRAARHDGAAGGKVALVLGGGAARGTAHIGVIRVLTDAGVPIDMILGTSMGSLIGGLYAAGFDVDALEEAVAEVDPNSAAELLLPPRGGILDGRPLAMLLDALVDGRRLDETAIPFYPVVIDLYSGEPQSAPPGPLADGIRASTAIPVLFDPVEIGGRFYYDGGLKQTIPTSLARSLGAAYVIAVDVTRDIPFEPGNVQANLSRIFISIVEEYNREELADTDVIIDPGLRDNTYMDFELSAGFVAAGELAARSELPRILADLTALGIELRPPGDPNRGHPIHAGWRERLAVARREIVLRPRPWNLGIDLGLSPAASGDGVTAAPVPVGSRLRVGLDLRDGVLGRGSVGASYALNVVGGDDAVQLRAGYRLSHAWAVEAQADVELAGGWSAPWDTRWAVRWFATPELTVEARFRWPLLALEGGGRWRGEGLWLDLDGTVGLDGGWTRAHLDARAAVGPADPRWSSLTLRGRAFVGASRAAPASERFSVGPATGLRGTPPDAWTTPTLAVATVELAARLGSGQSVLEAALITPSVWAFVDAAWFDDDGVATNVWAVGVGAGLDGSLFGFVPFTLGVDVGYGVTAGTWALGWRFGPRFPVAARW